MRFFDPHIHMTSRTTNDYEAMAAAGVRAIIEPAFWLGQPRTTLGAFVDYFSTLVGWERFRASQFGIAHYCAIGLNSKEANNEALAKEVLEVLPRFALKEGVVAVGEIGYDEITPAEERVYQVQLEFAREHDMVVMVHSPHRDKKRGILRSIEVAAEVGVPMEKLVIDHNNEETVEDTLNAGAWAAFTIYPHTKMGSERMAELVERYGPERIIVDSSADWGVSDPLSVPRGNVAERVGRVRAVGADRCRSAAVEAGDRSVAAVQRQLDPQRSGTARGRGRTELNMDTAGETPTAQGRGRDEGTPGIGEIARRILIAWEKLRIAYVAILGAPTLFFCLFDLWREPGFLTTAVLGAVFANLAYFLGPAIEVYAAWLGFHHWSLRVTLFVSGTLLAFALTLFVLMGFVMATF